MDITVPAAKAQCESLGMRLAMFHTQADWEAAKSFLNAYNTLFGFVRLHEYSYIKYILHKQLVSF